MTYDSDCWSDGSSRPLVSNRYRYYSCKITIKHWQLRDLVVVNSNRPSEVIYPSGKSVDSIDIANGTEKTLAEFDFEPRCLQVSDEGWIAAGGVLETGSSTTSLNSCRGRFSLHNPSTGRQFTKNLGELINNSVVFHRQPNSSTTDRALVCNNDCSLYSVDLRDSILEPLSQLRLQAPLNNACISPDTKTVVVCGDTPDITICHPESGNTGWEVSRIAKSDADYGFSAAFHPSGTHFGVAYQNGECLLYDIRYLNKPFTSIKSSRFGNPLGAFRCIKFAQGSEDLLFLTEQMERVHIVDLRNPEDHQILSIPLVFDDQEEPENHPQIPSISQHTATASTRRMRLETPPLISSSVGAARNTSSNDSADFSPADNSQMDNFFEPNHSPDSSNTGELRSVSGPTSNPVFQQRLTNAWQESVIRDFNAVMDLTTRTMDPTFPNDRIPALDSNALERRVPPPALRTRYGQSEFGISGLEWSSQDDGNLIVGTDNGLAVWKVDGWARRTFPTYTIR